MLLPRLSKDSRPLSSRVERLAGFVAATPRNWPYALALTVVLVSLATALRVALDDVLKMRAPYATYYLAVALGSVLGGYRAGLITLIASALVGWWAFTEPRFSFRAMTTADVAAFLLFWFAAAFVGLVAASLRHAILLLRKRDEELRLIASELNHRVKNTLGNVRSIARLMARTAPDVQAFEAAFDARLKALAAAHDLLARSNWAGADLRSLICAHLAPFVSAEGPKLVLLGPDLMVKSEAAVSLSLMLHELTTNAVKYGALSRPSGEVRVTWTRDSATGEVVLDWRERGGPKVEAPEREGFGSTLLAQLLAGGVMEFEPDGLHAVARLQAEG